MPADGYDASAYFCGQKPNCKTIRHEHHHNGRVSIERFLDLSEEEAVVITRNDGRPIKIEAINSDDFLRCQAKRCTP